MNIIIISVRPNVKISSKFGQQHADSLPVFVTLGLKSHEGVELFEQTRLFLAVFYEVIHGGAKLDKINKKTHPKLTTCSYEVGFEFPQIL